LDFLADGFFVALSLLDEVLCFRFEGDVVVVVVVVAAAVATAVATVEAWIALFVCAVEDLLGDTESRVEHASGAAEAFEHASAAAAALCIEDCRAHLCTAIIALVAATVDD
jgi:hypothetical protein